MLKANYWNKDTLHRWYLSHPELTDKAWLALKSRRVVVDAKAPLDAEFVQACLLGMGVNVAGLGQTPADVTQSLTDLGVMGKAGGRTGDRKPRSAPPAPSSYDPLGGGESRDAKALFVESESLNLATAPFKTSTLKTGIITVDTREPTWIAQRLTSSKMGQRIASTGLAIGDIKIHSDKSPRELLIERKTVNDFYSSILSSHAHSQAERLFDYQAEKADQGIEVRVVWLIESVESGTRSLYHTLPKVNMVDGMVAYLTGVLGQSVISVHGQNHSCYMILKLAQTFLEQQLFYPITSDNGTRVDRKGSERGSIVAAGTAVAGAPQHGVTVSHRGLEDLLTFFPGINRKVAAALAGTGRSLAEISQMSESEFVALDGVGKTTAAKLHDIMNSR